MSLDKSILKILACPRCKGELEYNEKEEALICKNCRLKFKIIDGIPDLLLEDAEKF